MLTTEQLRQAFKGLEFQEEGHMYTLKGNNLPSVTYTLKQFYTPFDKTIAKWVAKREGKTEEQVLEEWAEKGRKAIEIGNRVHNYAEELAAYFKGFQKSIRPPKGFREMGVYQFFCRLDPERYHILATELTIYNEELGYAGTIDLVLYDTQEDGILIVDWKTNEKLFKNYKKQTLNLPFEDLLDHNFNKYQLQVNLYRLALESKGFKVVGQNIVWLKKEPKDLFICFEELPTENYTDKLKQHILAGKVNDNYI